MGDAPDVNGGGIKYAEDVGDLRAVEVCDVNDVNHYHGSSGRIFCTIKFCKNSVSKISESRLLVTF